MILTTISTGVQEEGAELVVAITHMRIPNDRKLAAQVPEFDLVLGGHDHHYEVDFVPPHNVLVCKSGTDFRDMTRVDVLLPAGGGRPVLSWTRLTQDSSVPQDPAVAAVRILNSGICPVANAMMGFAPLL